MTYGDSSTGTPVTLVVSAGTVTPPPPASHGHLPFTGLDLVAALLLAALLLAVGTALALAAGARRPLAHLHRRTP